MSITDPRKSTNDNYTEFFYRFLSLVATDLATRRYGKALLSVKSGRGEVYPDEATLRMEMVEKVSIDKIRGVTLINALTGAKVDENTYVFMYVAFPWLYQQMWKLKKTATPEGLRQVVQILWASEPSQASFLAAAVELDRIATPIK